MILMFLQFVVDLIKWDLQCEWRYVAFRLEARRYKGGLQIPTMTLEPRPTFLRTRVPRIDHAVTFGGGVNLDGFCDEIRRTVACVAADGTVTRVTRS